MAINTYDKGDQVRLIGTFKDITGSVTDPTVVTVRVKNPLGTVTTPAATQESPGVYHVDVTLDESGTWWYRFEGTGAVVAAEETAFNVRDSHF